MPNQLTLSCINANVRHTPNRAYQQHKAAIYIPAAMASIDTTAPPHATSEIPEKSLSTPPEYKASVGVGAAKNHGVVDVVLRTLLFGTALVGVIVMVTAKQTKMIPVSVSPFMAIPLEAKFSDSPAFIYFVAALSVACLYSIISGLLSVLALMKPGGGSTKLQFHFVILDTLLSGIVAAATGTAGGVAYIGLKGNSHTRWNKICNVYSSFCRHYAASILMSLISSITLLLLVWLSVYVLSKKISRR